MNALGFSDRHLAILRYCAEEVERQQDGPLAVYDMVLAWEYALGLGHKPIDATDVLTLGRLIKPTMNTNGYRRVAVRVGPNLVRVRADDVPRCVEQLGEAIREHRITPELAYKEFEEIHPFLDGNGRVGKILFNWARGSLTDPVLPPDFFGAVNL